MKDSSVYQIVTARIIRLLETNVVPWERPWSCGEPAQNLVSRRPYRGVNAFLLNALNYSSPFFLSYNQANQLGGYVMEGERGTPVVFWKYLEVKAPDEPSGKKTVPFLRYHSVFNVTQCANIPAEKIPIFSLNSHEHEPIEAAERIVSSMPKRPEIRHGSGRACYFPSVDRIDMPDPKSFQSEQDYYSVLFHELAHSTGHQSRLNRKGSGGSDGEWSSYGSDTGFTTLYSFTARSGGNFNINSDGAGPSGRLILLGNTLYGTASDGGSFGSGALFKLQTDGTGFTTLYNFSVRPFPYFTGNSDGAYPYGGLILSGKTLFGITSAGGSSDSGTVFAINTDGTGFTNLYSFSATSTNSLGAYTNSDGAYPHAGLLLLGNTLYGTTRTGGTWGYGTVFSLSFSPQLNSVLSSSNIVLSWPTNYAGFDYSGFALQSTTNLTSPIWTTNLPTPIVINGQFTVTNPISGTQQFFRLSQ